MAAAETGQGLRQLKSETPARAGTYALASIRATKSCQQRPGPDKKNGSCFIFWGAPLFWQKWKEADWVFCKSSRGLASQEKFVWVEAKESAEIPGLASG